MSGSSPSATNSVEPMANPPSARAARARATTPRECCSRARGRPAADIGTHRRRAYACSRRVPTGTGAAERGLGSGGTMRSSIRHHARSASSIAFRSRQHPDHPRRRGRDAAVEPRVDRLREPRRDEHQHGGHPEPSRRGDEAEDHRSDVPGEVLRRADLVQRDDRADVPERGDREHLGRRRTAEAGEQREQRDHEHPDREHRRHHRGDRVDPLPPQLEGEDAGVVVDAHPGVARRRRPEPGQRHRRLHLDAPCRLGRHEREDRPAGAGEQREPDDDCGGECRGGDGGGDPAPREQHRGDDRRRPHLDPGGEREQGRGDGGAARRAAARPPRRRAARWRRCGRARPGRSGPCRAATTRRARDRAAPPGPGRRRRAPAPSGARRAGTVRRRAGSRAASAAARRSGTPTPCRCRRGSRRCASSRPRSGRPRSRRRPAGSGR